MLAREIAHAPEEIQLVFEWREASGSCISKRAHGRIAAGVPTHERVVVFGSEGGLLDLVGRKGKGVDEEGAWEGKARVRTEGERQSREGEVESTLVDDWEIDEFGLEGRDVDWLEVLRRKVARRWKGWKRICVLRGRDRYGRV